MDAQIARDQIVQALTEVAPELDTQSLEDEAPIRQSYDLDSADFLNFIQAVHKRLGLSIPERDYPQLVTIGAAVRYVIARISDNK